MSDALVFAHAAALIADPARAIMLNVLLDGRARPAGELAHACGVTAQTASAHLGKLLDGGILVVESEGRHRYYRIASADVVDALENLATIAASRPARPKALSPLARQLRFCRCCYNHLAGKVGVAVAEALQANGYIEAEAGKRFRTTPAGATWFAGLGVEVSELKPGRYGVARRCLDWTERKPHLAGPLGAAFLKAMCDRGWLVRDKKSRSVRVTPPGQLEFKRRLGVDFARLASGDDGAAAPAREGASATV